MEKEMLYKIGLWLVKLMAETKATEIEYELKNVTNKKGEKLGNYKLKFYKS
jgi:hypothetical protein